METASDEQQTYTPNTSEGAESLVIRLPPHLAKLAESGNWPSDATVEFDGDKLALRLRSHPDDLERIETYNATRSSNTCEQECFDGSGAGCGAVRGRYVFERLSIDEEQRRKVKARSEQAKAAAKERHVEQLDVAEAPKAAAAPPPKRARTPRAAPGSPRGAPGSPRAAAAAPTCYVSLGPRALAKSVGELRATFPDLVAVGCFRRPTGRGDPAWTSPSPPGPAADAAAADVFDAAYACFATPAAAGEALAAGALGAAPCDSAAAAHAALAGVVVYKPPGWVSAPVVRPGAEPLPAPPAASASGAPTLRNAAAAAAVGSDATRVGAAAEAVVAGLSGAARGALRFVAPELRDPERARAAKKRVDYLGPELAASRRSFHARWSRADDDLEVAELALALAVDEAAATARRAAAHLAAQKATKASAPASCDDVREMLTGKPKRHRYRRAW